ncbi:MAG TPA: glycosyltransferase family 2 protein [Gemmataceae bacterium]|jgi:dolichol-phosphate mannosyltransferase
MNELKLSVVIPAYNEEKNLPQVLNSLQSEFRKERIPYEIIVVNDNSRDGTAAVIAGFMAEDAGVRTVNRRQPGGIGRAIRSGLDLVTGDVVIVYMADCSDHPGDAVAYYRKIEEGYDCVFGSRFIKGSKVTDYPRVKLIINRIVNKTMQWLFLCPFNDLTNAFKAYRADVLRECGPFRASHFNITIEMSLAAVIRNYYIAQVPIGWTGREWGSSNLRITQMGRRYLSTLIKSLAEWFLISDDLLSERLAVREAHRTRLPLVENRLAALEQRVQAIERELEADRTPRLHDCDAA